jgi:hypothetical protein
VFDGFDELDTIAPYEVLPRSRAPPAEINAGAGWEVALVGAHGPGEARCRPRTSAQRQRRVGCVNAFMPLAGTRERQRRAGPVDAVCLVILRAGARVGRLDVQFQFSSISQWPSKHCLPCPWRRARSRPKGSPPRDALHGRSDRRHRRLPQRAWQVTVRFQANQVVLTTTLSRRRRWYPVAQMFVCQICEQIEGQHDPDMNGQPRFVYRVNKGRPGLDVTGDSLLIDGDHSVIRARVTARPGPPCRSSA